MSLFNLGSKSKLGIDIGTASIKIIELEDSSRFKLKNYGLFELQSDDEINLSTIETRGKNQVRLSDDDIVWGIKETLSRSKISTKDVVASIQSFSTFSTVITLPYLSEEETARAIPFEAKKYVPLPLSEVVLDWSIIGTTSPAKTIPVIEHREEATAEPSNKIAKQDSPILSPSPIVEVFMVAVPKDEANRYQSIMKKAGLNLRALELENTALIRAVMGNDLSPAVIVNIGGRSTSILIVDKGIERLAHNYEVGGFEITKSVSRSMNVSLKRAEELKRTIGLSQGNEGLGQAAAPLVDLIVFEAKKTIHNYEDSKKIKINKVFLVGGLANMPGFFDYFRNRINLEVILGNPTARTIIPTQLEAVRPELNSTFSVALGLAMRKL